MTTENNKLIAEFMGYEIKTYSTPISDIITPYGQISEDKLKFHSNWDWLMAVVEKIESLGYSFSIHLNWVKICPKGKPNVYIVKYGIGNTKIEATYKAVLEFIKWYNNENKI